ncbi:MAG: HipA domain-containing protein, partial [Treponema sp.]|nr:HipA domain-containing protein [Treponema sp.]
MLYTLCHKDIQVLSFEIENNIIIAIKEVFDKDHIPTGLCFEHNTEAALSLFNKWWTSRSIPASRQNLTQALELLGNITPQTLVTKSFGLSLSDHYWAKPSNSNLHWSDINFFQNDFSEDVGRALFGTLAVTDVSAISMLSPDNTSDGWLKKKWIIDNGKRILVKGGSGESQQEPFNELLATEICKRLGIHCTEYTIISEGWDYFSACNDFVSVDTEFIPASRIYSLKDYSGGLWDKYKHFKDMCAIAGMTNYTLIEKQLCSMFVLDFIIANTDRHFANFGFIRNPDTLEWLGLSPVFDSGSSLFNTLPTPFLEDKNKTDSAVITARPFGYKQSDQIKLLPCVQLCSDINFEALTDISDWYYTVLEQNKRIDEKRRSLLCSLLKNRV